MSPTKRVVGNPTLRGICFNLSVTGIKPLTMNSDADGHHYHFAMKVERFPFIPFMTRYFRCILTSPDVNLMPADILLAAETINRRDFFKGTKQTAVNLISGMNRFDTPQGELFVRPYAKMDLVIDGQW